MSPASQGNLEVERYIGSCLISARLNNNSSKNVSSSHPAGYKNKKVANGDGGGGVLGRGGGGGRLQSRPLLGCPPGPMVSCDCTRYGSPGRHTPAGWAGMPLISMAVNARRHRKPPPPGHGPPRVAKTAPGDGDAFLRTPLSRLAIHTQGAPLILSGHYGSRKNGAGHRGPNKQSKGDAQNGRRFNGDASAGREARIAGNNNGNTPSSDCLSVASDESSGHSENSLPRIIKPRKRRKKDRKPPASPPSEATGPESDPVTESSTIVTLKPYVPLCHDLYDGHRGGSSHRRDAKAWEKQRPCPEELERTSPTSEEDSKPREETDDGDALLNTLFPFRCAPSVCQCRYCDPSGLIWDVDQHCYSPFLTPPTLDLPFVNLFLSPPPEVKSLDLFNKDFENSSSPIVDADHKEPVRRSWSEPSASFSAREVAAAVPALSASFEFGVIGGGRKETRHSSTSSSEGLEVSTEIVTSLNGHRDIEIKFYSSSPPSAVSEGMSERWGEGAWTRVWEMPDSAHESSSKQLSDEVNQLCLHNVEE